MPEEHEVATTSATFPGHSPNLSDARRALIFGILRLNSAFSIGLSQCIRPDSAHTYLWRSPSGESSTLLSIAAPDTLAQLNSIFAAASRESLEDGMRNAITERLPELLEMGGSTIIPALISLMESGHSSPVVIAEVLKELGNLGDAGYRSELLWILERALTLNSHYIRDAAGLGLARFADSSAIPYLERAITRERNAELRADLQLVLDELRQAKSNGSPTSGSL